MKQFRRILNCIFASVFILMLMAAVGIEENSTYSKNSFDVDLSDGWMIIESDGNRSEMNFPYHFGEKSNNVQIVRTLPDVPDYSVLLVKCNYKSLTAYVDGEKIYYSLPSTFGTLETDLGHYVSIIPLDSGYSGKEIVIDIEERESQYNSDIKYIHLTSVAQYSIEKLEDDAVHLIISVILLILAAISFISWIVLCKWNGMIPEERYHSLLWITLFAASVGVWFLSEPHIWAVSTGSFATSGMFNYLAFSLMPVSLLGILKSTCSEKLVSLSWVVFIAKIVLITEWLLFLTGIVDFSSMLMLLQAACVVAVGIVGVFWIWKRSLFMVGNIIRYGIWIVFAALIMAVIAYLSGRDWMPMALLAVMVIIISIFVSTLVNVGVAIRDISKNKQYKEYALTDIMTGLKSRYAYTIFETQQKIGLPSEDLYLIFLDIDVLKRANDTLGHVAGDEMIIATSKCIKEAFGDIADCFRMGGDEFLVATTSKEKTVFERIEKFNALITEWNGRYIDAFTVSYGVAAAKDYPEMDFEELLKMADYNMYENKKQKATCV